MNRKIVLLVVTALVLIGGTSFLGDGSRQASAAGTFQRVDFISGVVTADRLNVRQGPSTEYSSVGMLEKGQFINVLAKIGNWYVIYEPNKGYVGAASANYIKQYEAGAVVTASNPATPGTTPLPTVTSNQKEEAAQTPAPGASPTSKTDNKRSSINEDAQQVLELINREREKAGLGALVVDEKLQEIATLRAEDMVEKNYFSHQSPAYGSPFDMMRQRDVVFKTAGENIAGNRLAENAVGAWVDSEEHRKNILNANFDYTGVAVVESSRYGKIFVQIFMGK